MPERWFNPPTAPTGVAFCTGCELGARSEGALLFGDYNHGTLWRARLSRNRLRVVGLVSAIVGVVVIWALRG